MENLPAYIYVVAIATTFLTIFLFYKATNYSRFFLVAIIAWLLLQAALGFSGFYTVTTGFPPRFMLLLLLPVLCIALLFVTKKGRSFIDALDIRTLTLLHVIRVPVELMLLVLFLHKAIPQLMTFEGRNFDILSGITAPFAYYFGFAGKRSNPKILLAWNFACLALLINIVVNAILAAPSPFQKFAFEQPNIAIMYFPFIWLPCCIVPLVLLAHLASIRKLIKVVSSSNNKVLADAAGVVV